MDQSTNNTALAVADQPRPLMLRPIVTPSEAIVAHKEAVAFIQEALVDGQDYGKIPGTGDKKNLLKPGAERLCSGFGLRAEYEILEQQVDHDRHTEFSITKWVQETDPGKAEKERLKGLGLGRNRQVSGSWQWQVPVIEKGEALGLYRYVVKCRLITFDGREVGQGVGTCSSLESKYIRAPRDSENTILKMGKKRAYVDAVLTTLGLSDRFTQDVEDISANKVARNEDDYTDSTYIEEHASVAPAAAEPTDPFAVTTAQINAAIAALKIDAEQGKEWTETLGGLGFTCNRYMPLFWGWRMGARDVQDLYLMLDCEAIAPTGPNIEKWTAKLDELAQEAAAHADASPLEEEGRTPLEAGFDAAKKATTEGEIPPVAEAVPNTIEDAVNDLLAKRDAAIEGDVSDLEWTKISGTMPEGFSFHGWVPNRWPLAKQWLTPGSEQQRRLLISKLEERGLGTSNEVADKLLDAVASAANQPARNRSTGAYAITNDFLMQGDSRSILEVASVLRINLAVTA